jgi:hypothetical protein
MKIKVKKPIALSMVIVIIISMFTGIVSASGAKVSFNANTKVVNFTYGSVTLATGNNSPLTGIRHLTLSNLWNNSATSSVDIKKRHTTLGQIWESGQSRAELETTVSSEYDGSLTVNQSAETQAQGITGIQWGLVVPDTYDLIIPVLGGIRLTSESPDAAYGFQQFDYPNVWEAQMLLIQGANGGMLVHADDDTKYFKSLHVKHEDGNFYVGMETYSPAPFDQVTQAISTDWRLQSYAGDWVKGANLYRKWADKEFDLSKLKRYEPKWTKDIQFTVLTDLEDKPMLEALANKVNASQTLLVVPGWRMDPYDVNFPDYTPKPDMKAKIEAAQALGYKVMLYVNIFGVTPENPAYATMQAYQVKDPFTNNPIFSEYTAGSQHIKFAQINPASQAWRQLFVDKMVDLTEILHPDGIHLDQSLLMYNDANGLVDGMNMMEGNVALHRDLRNELPRNVALGGESLNEITTRYESFAQRHAYGIFSQNGTWDNSKIDQVIPVSSAIFAPYTTQYGHPDHANPITEDYFIAWHKVVQNRLGAVPILTRPNADQILNETPLMEQFLKEAKWYQEHKPKADFSQWSGNTLYAFRTATGNSASYQRDAYGEKLTAIGLNGPNGGSDVLRYLYGVESVELPGTISNWYLYDNSKLFGLNKDKTYLYSDETRDPLAFHVYELPSDVTMKRLSVKADHAVVSLQDELQASDIDFLSYPGPIRAGEKLNSGVVNATNAPFSSENGFSYSFAQGGTVQHWGDRILAHPPYMGQWQGGHTWLEFDVQLPADYVPNFEVGVQLGSEVNVQNSDGVTFKMYAWETAAPVATRQVLNKVQFSRGATPTSVNMDLTILKGKEITIRLETHSGVTVDNDSAVWVKPHIVLEPESSASRIVNIKLVSPKPITSVTSTSGLALMTSIGNNQYDLAAAATDNVYLFYSGAGAAQLPLSLRDESFESSLWFENGTEGQPQGPFGGIVGSGAVQGVQKQGLDAHPPQRGQTHIDYVVNIPANGALLSGFAGIKDGAEDSGGVGFRIAVNGVELWNANVLPDSGWKPFNISLAAYAGKSIVLSLVTDSMGDYGYDWAFWGEPMLTQN